MFYFRLNANKISVFKCAKSRNLWADKFLIYSSISNWTHSNVYYIPINDTTLELSVFWPSDTENRINELRFSESISLPFKTRLTSVTCFCGDVK